MKTRVISSLAGIALLLVILTAFHKVTFNIIAVIVYLISLWEIRGVFKEKNTDAVFAVLAALGAYFLLQPYIPQLNHMVVVCFVMTVFAASVVFNFHTIDFKNVSASLLFGLYVLMGFYSMLNMKTNMPYETFGWDSTFMFISCCTIAWGADVFAYFAGYFFGKHKLAPTLSPKKTKEGAVGGTVGSVVVTWAFFWLYSIVKPIIEGTGITYTITSRQLIILGVLAFIGSFYSMFGDLFASAIKRQVGVKDYGNIMPGHGGVLDRFDSVILVSPLVSALSFIVVNRGGIFNV